MDYSENKDQTLEIREWQNRIYEYRKDAVSQFNKQLVYLNSGGLVLSIGFVKDIVDLTSSKCNILLIITWLFFTLSLLLNLISYKSTMKSMDYELNNILDKSDKQDVITNRLDNGSVFTLIIAILIFVIFISLNTL